MRAFFIAMIKARALRKILSGFFFRSVAPMNSSLRDQLLSLGLVTEKQAKQANRQEQQQRQYRNHSTPKPKSEPQPLSRPAPSVAARQAQAAKVARDLELNQRRQEKAARKARIAQIEQLIEQHRLPRLDTDDHFSFIDGKKIRRVAVDAQRREQLMRGELAFVRYRGHYAVVPKAIAERIREQDESMFVPHVRTDSRGEQDDPYKDYVVPDDLRW
jgi:uncharacterized protein